MASLCLIRKKTIRILLRLLAACLNRLSHTYIWTIINLTISYHSPAVVRRQLGHVKISVPRHCPGHSPTPARTLSLGQQCPGSTCPLLTFENTFGDTPLGNFPPLRRHHRELFETLQWTTHISYEPCKTKMSSLHFFNWNFKHTSRYWKKRLASSFAKWSMFTSVISAGAKSGR